MKAPRDVVDGLAGSLARAALQRAAAPRPGPAATLDPATPGQLQREITDADLEARRRAT